MNTEVHLYTADEWIKCAQVCFTAGFTFICHLLNRYLQFMCHETNDREDDEPSKYTGGTVCTCHYNGVPAKQKQKRKKREKTKEK